MTLYMLFVGFGILIYTAAVTIAAAASQGSTEAQGIIASNRAPAAIVAVESETERAAGEMLFQELGCIACHRPDGKGIGPSLTGVFGRPVADAACGALTVDEAYVRESILNPTATVAEGFPPVMPSFAGNVTEEEIQALVAYVKSLSTPVQAPRKPIGESR